MNKEERIQQIARALKPAFRAYLLDQDGWEGVTPGQRRTLDAVLRDPEDRLLLGPLTGMMLGYGTGTDLEANAYYNIAVAVGAQEPERRGFFDDLTSGETYRYERPLERYNYPTNVPPVPGEPASGQQPGGGEATRSPAVDAILDLMNPEFRKWYSGQESGLSVAERRQAAEALEDPSDPDFARLARFAVDQGSQNPVATFVQKARAAQAPVVEEEERLEEVGRTAAEARLAYYDPMTSTVRYLTADEARRQGLSRVEEPAAAPAPAPAAAPSPAPGPTRAPTRAPAAGPSEARPTVSPETMVSVYNPMTSTVERMTAQEAIDLGLMSKEEVSAAYGAGVGVTGVAVSPGAVPYAGPSTDGAGGVVPDGDVGGGVGGVPAPEEDVMLPEDWEQAAQEQYGAYWAIFKYNPELKQILLDATQQDWSDDKFRAAIEATTWWKTTTESARVFDMEEATDPATVQTKIDNRAMELKGIALNQGVTLSDETAAQIARDSLRGGWSYQTYTTAVTAEAVKSTAGLSQLRAGAIGEKIRQTAYDYGISLSDTEINTYVNKFAVGEESDETFEGKMREWAKVLYPAISSNIDSGSTFQDVIDPYRSKAAALLELEPDQIDFLDSKYLAAITKTNDKGEQSMMSAREWEQELRTNRSFGYEFTQRAQSDAYRVADQIADLFGRV